MKTTIQATALTSFEVAPDGDSITLSIIQTDRTLASVRLPFSCISQLLMTLPEVQVRALRAKHGDPSLRVAYSVGHWALEGTAQEGQVMLTLSTKDGFQASFVLAAKELVQMGNAASKTLGDISIQAVSH